MRVPGPHGLVSADGEGVLLATKSGCHVDLLQYASLALLEQILFSCDGIGDGRISMVAKCDGGVARSGDF